MSSGIYTWLREEIEQHFEDGAALIEESKQQGNKKHAWLMLQLEERGATDLLEQFRARMREDAAMRRQRDRRRVLAGIEEQLAGNREMGKQQRSYLEKRAGKLRAAILERMEKLLATKPMQADERAHVERYVAELRAAIEQRTQEA